MTVRTRRLHDVRIDDHTLTVPLSWASPADGRTIDIFASVVTRDGGERLPHLLFLQGGPGHEAARPYRNPTSPGWLDAALEHYRVVLLDQRGTGHSTPIGDADLGRGLPELLDRLTHLRADSIVADAEVLREHLGVRTWSTLGQSFGGFTTLTYLSTHAASLAQVFITGGLSAVGADPVEVYTATYDKLRWANAHYYRQFPEHRGAVARLLDRADSGRITLPTGEVVSASRVRSLGTLLGSDDGWQLLHGLLEQDPATNAFVHDLAAALPFGGRNPLYYLIHESCYADGTVTDWAAHRALPDDFRTDPTLLTGEHIHPDWASTVPALQPWREVADAVAAIEWPRLYDEDAIAASRITGAAAVYYNDLYVPVEQSMATAALMPGVRTWVTSEYEHSGLRSGQVLPRLIDLAHGRLRR